MCTTILLKAFNEGRQRIFMSSLNNILLFPTSLAVTEGILVSFFFYAALTDMFKFSAYPYLS